MFLSACKSVEFSHVEQIQFAGELRVATLNNATSYYIGSDGPTGLDYELARQFADFLQVRLVLLPQNDIATTFSMLESGAVDMIAAGVTINAARQQQVKFSPSYYQLSHQVIYRLGTKRPKSVEDLIGLRIVVGGGSSHAERLRALKSEYPELSWQEIINVEQEELIDMVLNDDADVAVIDSNILNVNRRFQPDIGSAFTLTEPQPLAWAFSKNQDDSLLASAVEFFGILRSHKVIEQLVERFYGHIDKFDYVDNKSFIRAAQDKLPSYLTLFQDSANDILNWQLLAAISYQESHWEPDAVSPTGVRGLMMLTQNTAKQVKVADRTDPQQSIEGGARYFMRTYNRIPERIAEPDRTWFAMAAYNVGFGHLEDARRLAQQHGDNPDKWLSVQKYLPLLSQKKYYQQTRYGYARGHEPVHYVKNIRRYYEILKWMDEQGLLANHETNDTSDNKPEAPMQTQLTDESNPLPLTPTPFLNKKLL